MTSGQIEAIHKICLRAESRSRSIGPQTLYKWNIPQSVDWFKMVASRWVFVAASDHSVFRLLCWDMLSISSGSSAPLAECFLPARVNSGMIEVQSEGLLVCLGLGPTSVLLLGLGSQLLIFTAGLFPKSKFSLCGGWAHPFYLWKLSQYLTAQMFNSSKETYLYVVSFKDFRRRS